MSSSARGPGESDGPTPGAPARGCLGIATGLLIAVLVVGAAFSGVALGRCTHAATPTPAPSVSTDLKATPNVITAIRDLARLESAEYHVERVIDLTDKQSRFFGLIEAKDAVLLVAAGDVIAGIDLAELRDTDVAVESPKRVRITLPPAKILSAHLDNQQTYVHTRTTDVLAKRAEDLETRARQEAEHSIVEGARQSGIIGRARQNAQRTIEALAHSLGYTEVELSFRER